MKQEEILKFLWETWRDESKAINENPHLSNDEKIRQKDALTTLALIGAGITLWAT